MGTNFYHRYNICACCDRYDERHIGKGGVNFRGYRRPDWLDDDAPYEYVLSWADWKRQLTAGGEVWDEYGTQWDVAEFIAYVERSTPAQRRRQYDWVVAHRWQYGGAGNVRDWLDPELFSFTDQEFC